MNPVEKDDPFELEEQSMEGQKDVDVVIVGAGFAGLHMLHKARELGLSARVYEKAGDVGGAWYWNRYPGARCDSESHVYCYSFSDEILEEWDWSERYPEQPEILEYFRFVADRLDLRKDIEFNSEVTAATFDDSTGLWDVEINEESTVSSHFFISGVGNLTKPFVPDFDGLDSFEGEQHHTARWPHEPVEFSGKRVGVIGTGSSGMQIVPEIAQEADELKVFQRTPNYAVPARNRPYDDGEFEEIRDRYDEIWKKAHKTGGGLPYDTKYDTAEGMPMDEVRDILDEYWEKGGPEFRRVFEDLLTNEETNKKVSQYIRERIREIVDDPETGEKLAPEGHPYGAKRPPQSYNNYWHQYNRDNVSLVDVDENPITEITRSGIQTSAEHHELDMIVFATGFDAFTGALFNMKIQGKNGISIEEEWDEGPKTYLGLMAYNFPNMFLITGPQSPSVLTNVPVAIHQHVEWIGDCIEYMFTNDYRFIEPTKEATEQWTEHTNDVAEGTVFTQASSWYSGDNVPDKPNSMLPYVNGLDTYREKCNEIAESGYKGFSMYNSINQLAS